MRFSCRHYYSKAVQANPYHAVAHFNLGLLLHDEDVETAMEHYQVRVAVAVELCRAFAGAEASVGLSCRSPRLRAQLFQAAQLIRFRELPKGLFIISLHFTRVPLHRARAGCQASELYWPVLCPSRPVCVRTSGRVM